MIKHRKLIAILISVMVALQTLPAYATEYGEMIGEVTDVTSEEIEENEQPSEESTEASIDESADDSATSDEDTDNSDTVSGNESGDLEADTEPGEDGDGENKRPSPLRTMSIMSTRSGSLPSSYDARDDGIVTPVKSQNGGICYIYAATALAEISLLKNFPEDFSADTLFIDEEDIFYNLYNSNPDPLGLIGNDHAVGDRNTGSNIDALFPEFASYSCPVARGGEAYYDTIGTLNKAFSVKVSNLTIDDIKNLILEYGSVGADVMIDQDVRSYKIYYPYSRYGTLVRITPPHGVALIGWDDAIPASDFTNEYGDTPSVDGGFLFKNSWGEGRGENGYYWLSYEDMAVASSIFTLYALSFDRAAPYNVYQYDGGNSTSRTSALKAANVFEAKANADGTERLVRIGAFLSSGNYNIKVYKYDAPASAPWEQQRLLGNTSLTVPENEGGYHSVVLSNPIQLDYGEKFSVCIEKTDGTSFGIGADYNGNGNSTRVNAGESFIKAPNSSEAWEDAKTCPFVGPQGANLRIKAFTLNNNDGAFSTRTIKTVTVSETPTYTGNAITPDVVIKDTDGNEINKRYCNITYSGNVNAGTATVTVTPKSSHITGSASTTFTISPRSMTGASITLQYDTTTYNGTDKKPTATVTLNGRTLTEGTDYTLSYENNRNAGRATVTATGKGNYSGTAAKNFTISTVNAGNATVECDTTVEYTGSALTPDVTVKVNGRTLVKDTDYTLAYHNNVDVGTAFIVVSFIGNYYGEVRKNFEIVHRDGTICTVEYENPTPFTGYDIEPAVTVKYRGTLLSEGTDYTVRYTDNRNVTDNARFTVSFRGQYSGSITKTFSITPADPSVLTFDEFLDNGTRVYNGSSYTPAAPDVALNGYLTKNVDYTLSYRDNVNAGTGYIVYSFKGNYRGTKEIPFTISPLNLQGEAVIGDIGDQVYTGTALTPGITVRRNSTELINGIDYTATYENNTAVGTATVRVTGRGNYTGTLVKTFRITEDPSHNVPEKPVNPENPGNGGGTGGNGEGNEQGKEEEPTVKTWTMENMGYKAEFTVEKDIPYSPNPKEVAASLHPTLSVTDDKGKESGITIKNVKATKPKKGTTKITITLKGSTKEERKAIKALNKKLKSMAFEITPKDITRATVIVKLNKKRTKVTKVTVDKVKLKKEDFTAVINTDSVTITGKGNYTGTYISK